ncbi:MAG: T9SS type A sorting domain-containing protein [Bacteroidetes bacterium]|nr:T9SS type A sorting domain-containing protein [Bacteroidota bacterium]
MERFLLCLAGFLLTSSAFAQSPIIEGFRVVQVGDAVQLDWFIPQGLSCLNMEVQRSEDSLAFATLNTVFGLCGSNDSDSPYDYTDAEHDPGRRTYWYRIYASSGTVVSEVLRLNYRQFEPGQLILSPNPLTGAGTAQYVSLSGENLRLRWVNLQGQEIKTQLPGAPGQFDLQRNDLPAGVYVLQVISENGEIRDTQKMVLP